MSNYSLTKLFRIISKTLSQQLSVTISTPDNVTDQLLISQYAYEVYSKYEALIEIDCNNYSKNYLEKIEEKNVLIFLYNSNDISEIKNLLKKCVSIKYIIFKHENIYIHENAISFYISKDFAKRYIEYLMSNYPHVITLSEMDQLIEISGCNLYNIKHLMQLCYNYQKSINQIQNEDILLTSNYNETMANMLGWSSIGIHKKLAKFIIDEKQLSLYLKQQKLFINDDYILPEIFMHLHCIKHYSSFDFLKMWISVASYIKELDDDKDKTIVNQIIWLLQKTMSFKRHILIDLEDVIFSIEETLYDLYRFSNNKELQKLEELCKQCFEDNKKVHIYSLVNEAILYTDIEKYDVAKEKFKYAFELCKKNHDKETFSYVVDEFSRLLEKTSKHNEALKKLYFVEKYYMKERNWIKLRNVRNRIGLNLCDIGKVKKGTKYLEQLYFRDFNGEINTSVVLNCEVANNLSICYMESGTYNKALALQDDLYKKYLYIDNAPINYSTDILQNKGNVYLYNQEFDDAKNCFEQALADEKNPLSRQYILENYVYAKSFAENDFNDGILFFESILAQEQEKNYETCKMLAEMYFASKHYVKCSKFCTEVMKNIRYNEYRIIYFSLDSLYIRCMIKLERLSILNKISALFRLYKYRNFIRNKIGIESPYYKEIQISIDMLKK